MQARRILPEGAALLLLPALTGWLGGVAVLLQQRELYAWPVYMAFVLLALFLISLVATQFIAFRWRAVVVLMALGLLGFCATGLRASVFLSQALGAELEGRDLTVTGLIAAMPQRSDSALRFRFKV